MNKKRLFLVIPSSMLLLLLIALRTCKAKARSHLQLQEIHCLGSMAVTNGDSFSFEEAMSDKTDDHVGIWKTRLKKITADFNR